MDAAQFANLPELPLGGKRDIIELHVLLCDSPRPVAVRVKQGLRLLPTSMWCVAEFVARAVQDLEVSPLPRCTINQFLTLLLAQAIMARGVLAHEPAGEGVLSLLLVREVCEKPAKMLALPAPLPTLALPAPPQEKQEQGVAD